MHARVLLREQLHLLCERAALATLPKLDRLVARIQPFAALWTDRVRARIASLRRRCGGVAPAIETRLHKTLIRASQRVGTASDDGYFEFVVVPDDASGGVGAEKDFAVKVFTADAGSGNAPALATALVVARVTGDFVSLT